MEYSEDLAGRTVERMWEDVPSGKAGGMPDRTCSAYWHVEWHVVTWWRGDVEGRVRRKEGVAPC